MEPAWITSKEYLEYMLDAESEVKTMVGDLLALGAVGNAASRELADLEDRVGGRNCGGSSEDGGEELHFGGVEEGSVRWERVL
jgi:hypothetical protein